LRPRLGSNCLERGRVEVFSGAYNKNLEIGSILLYYKKVRTFKNAWFNRFSRKEGISDDELRDVVDLLEKGQADADLGGDVYKQRIARSGEGKSGDQIEAALKEGVLSEI